MFGYVKIYPDELKMKDYYKYKAYYCGLCHTLKERYGRIGQMSLTYDMTFLIILLTSLYETETKREQYRCILHPVKKHETLVNDITEYVSDMNIILTYHHFRDDWKDEKSLPGLGGSVLLKRYYEKIRLTYPRQCQKIIECLDRLEACEKSNEPHIDVTAGCFGEMMAEFFVFHQDIWEDRLRKIGFFLGKFIYIMDAYEDLEKDLKNKSFNPLADIHGSDQYEQECQNMLTMMIAECTSEFEKLPCIMDVDILRNILYEGVWVKYNGLKKQEENAKRRELRHDD